jgi:hypothetical protein
MYVRPKTNLDSDRCNDRDGQKREAARTKWTPTSSRTTNWSEVMTIFVPRRSADERSLIRPVCRTFQGAARFSVPLLYRRIRVRIDAVRCRCLEPHSQSTKHKPHASGARGGSS